MNKISVTIITKNEQDNIEDCLKSVSWADEVIVVDSGSTDKTVEIAKKYTDKVYYKEWIGFADQKTYALSLASNHWVLSLDADERITGELKDEILNKGLGKFNGYYIRRKNYFLDKEIKQCGWGSDYQLRLFLKGKTKLTDRLVHEGFAVDGKLSRLQNQMIHLTHTDLKKTFAKINDYSTLEAVEKVHRKKVNGFTIIFNPLVAFLQHYFIRKGFLDGVHGLMVSINHAMTKLQVYMKMWELKFVKKKKDK
ncbi:MAG: glycosyltransferase family 2 protein [Ignavibacteria bacterium]|jgi:glycosyltransferase involved in cell wall biosynthesis